MPARSSACAPRAMRSRPPVAMSAASPTRSADDAETICNLADDLGEERHWAQDKCSSAKASCRDAKKKCCGCSESKPATPGATAKAISPGSAKVPTPRRDEEAARPLHRLMIIVACAASAKGRPTRPRACRRQRRAGDGERRQENRADRLYADICRRTGARCEFPEAPTPMCEGGACGRPTPMRSRRPSRRLDDNTCKPANSDTCTRAARCRLDSARTPTRICRKLADELQPDNDAAAKCEKATATCKTSHEKCCSCL